MFQAVVNVWHKGMRRHTKFDNVSYDTHDNKPHADRLRDLDKFALVGCSETFISLVNHFEHKDDDRRGVTNSMRGQQRGKLTFGTSIHKLGAITKEVFRDVGNFFELVRHLRYC